MVGKGKLKKMAKEIGKAQSSEIEAQMVVVGKKREANCWGLGNPQSVNALRKIVRQWDPSFVFLLETKLKKKAMERANRKVGFVYRLVVPKSD